MLYLSLTNYIFINEYKKRFFLYILTTDLSTDGLRSIEIIGQGRHVELFNTVKNPI